MRIGSSTYSFRDEFAKKSYLCDPNGLQMLKTNHPSLEGLEVHQWWVDTYFKKTDPKDMKELKQMLNQAGFEWYALTIDSGSMPNANLVPHYHDYASYVEGFKRDHEFRIGFASEWIENAAAAGVKLMRVDPGPFFMNHKINYSMSMDFNINQNIPVYQELCKMAKEYDIQIGIENHGGFVSDPNVLKKLFAAVPDLRFVFDFGNVTDALRYQMVSDFADRISFVHAKSYVFNDQGEETYINFGKILQILKDKGFDGWLSIEFEGPGSGDVGVEKTIKLLQKHMK